jgi:hypothetical protein
LSLLGFENARPVSQARAEVGVRLWHVQTIVPERAEEQRRALRALIDVPTPLTIEELVRILL